MSDLVDSLAFQVHALKLPPPDFEVRFHPTRRWRFDMAWPALLLACEIEGGTWVGGLHTRPIAFEADCEKYNEAALLNWRVLRVTNHMVEDGRAVAFLERALGGPAMTGTSLSAQNLYGVREGRDG